MNNTTSFQFDAKNWSQITITSDGKVTIQFQEEQQPIKMRRTKFSKTPPPLFYKGYTHKEEKKKNIKKKKRFCHPSVEEVKQYCQERGNKVDPELWYDFYQSKGWMVGRNKMKDWKSAVRTWERNQLQNNKLTKPGPGFISGKYSGHKFKPLSA